MMKNILIAAAILGNVYVSDAIYYRTVHESCTLTEKASDDYYYIRNFIYSFLERAETDFRTISDYDKNITCESSKGNLSELIKQAKIDWANCLTDEYAYFGDFVNDTLQNLLDFFCEPGNEQLEGYFAEESKQCRAIIKKPFFDTCLKPFLSAANSRINYDLSYNIFTIPWKRDRLCLRLLDLGPCTTDILEQYCPHLTSYQQLSAKLYSQVLTPCNEYISFLSVGRIVGVTLTSISVLIILIIRFCPVRKWYEDFKHRNSSKSLTNSVI